jgi:outer membrane protein assembly factor BamE (lipoprotein component of BamABCDE complex)
MKRWLIFILCLGFIGCATAGKMNLVSLGMTKSEVISTMGKPVSTSATDGTEYLNYRFSETSDDDFMGRATPYYVCIRDGKVISFGRMGDFDSTKDPTQVIKILGDMKSDEQIRVKTEQDDQLVNKLRTLNKLLSDGLLTKDEFNEQKKKLLSEYTGK